MRVLFDVNVVLDVLLSREPWRADAQKLWDHVAQDVIEGYLAPTTVTTIYYLARKLPAGAGAAKQAVQACLSTFDICPVDRQTLELALAHPGVDCEDNVQMVSAQLIGADAIVTRNLKHFTGAPCDVLMPADLLTRIP